MEATPTTDTTPTRYLDRDETIRRIRAALRKRSGKTWSVTGGRGTAWGWITIDAPPARRTHAYRLNPDSIANQYVEIDTYEPGGNMGPSDRAELARLLALDSVHQQGVNIPASSDYYREYLDRAEGIEPSVIGRPYWD